MSKWTDTNEEIRHLCETSRTLWDTLMQSFYISIHLLDGRDIRGRFSGTHAENNGGRGGQWQYCETITIQIDSGERIEIDLLDVRSVTAIRQ